MKIFILFALVTFSACTIFNPRHYSCDKKESAVPPCWQNGIYSQVIIKDSLTFKGYLVNFERKEFGNYNNGWMLCDSTLVNKLVSDTKIDLYEKLFLEGGLPILYIQQEYFPHLKWNLENPEGQKNTDFYLNVPDSLRNREDFKKNFTFGSFEFKMKNELIPSVFKKKDLEEYLVTIEEVELTGIIINCGLNVSLPFFDGFLEAMMLKKYCKIDVFVPMEIKSRSLEK